MIKRKKDDRKGFTLVELLISIALFSVLVSVAVGGFVRALRTERQVSAMMSAESNVSIGLEEMTREMRLGYLFCDEPGSQIGSPIVNSACSSWCTVPASSPGNIEPWVCSGGIAFYDSTENNGAGAQVEYFLGDSQNAYAPTSTTLYRLDSSQNIVSGVPEPVPVTGDNIKITNLDFVVFGNFENDQWNPRVTISVGAQPNDNTISWSTADLETTVSARTVDCTVGPSPQC